MTKNILVGAAAFAFLAGSAMAQDYTNSTTTTTTNTAPAMGSYSTSKSQRSIDANGYETDRSQSYSTGVNGTSSSYRSQETAPDGSVVGSTRITRSVTPSQSMYPQSGSTTVQTTTTDGE